MYAIRSYYVPAPEAPTTATDSPALTARLTSSRMVSVPSGLPTSLRNFFASSTVLLSMRAFFLVLSLVLCSLSGGGVTAAWAADRPVILVLGDSLSAGYGIPADQGWVARLQRRLDREGYGYTVVNASVSGEIV